MKKLDLGCGTSKKEGYTGVDSLKLEGVDIQHNLNLFPYPFQDNEIDEIWMDNVLEHLEEPLKVIEEIHRICKSGARVYIAVPYFRSLYAVIDPTHRNFFSAQWFNYFDPTHLFHQKYRYSDVTFEIEKIEFDREFKNSKISVFHHLLIKLAEKKTFFYETRLSHLFPLNSLTFYLKVKK